LIICLSLGIIHHIVLPILYFIIIIYTDDGSGFSVKPNTS